MIWNIRKQETTSQNKEEKKKKESNKTKDSVSSLWDSFKHSHHRGARRGRKSKKLEIYLKNNERKLP